MKLSIKYDRLKGGIEIKDKTKSQLLIDLMKSGVDTSKKIFLKDELIDLCSRHNIATTYQKVRIEKGWRNSPKGMLQFF